MKVSRPGTLVFIPGRAVTVADWTFQLLQGERHSEGTRASRRAQLLAALAYIATISGVDLDPESVHPANDRTLKTWRAQDLASERAAANTITRAKARAKT